MTNESEDLQTKLTPDHVQVLKAMLMEPDLEKDWVHAAGQTLRERCPAIAPRIDALVRELKDAGLVGHFAHNLGTARSGRGAQELRGAVTPAGLAFAQRELPGGSG